MSKIGGGGYVSDGVVDISRLPVPEGPAPGAPSMRSEPLPDTPFCRVLPSGHEVHWWDKSGNECLCGAAAKVKPRAEVDRSKYTVVTTLAMRKRHLAREMFVRRLEYRPPPGRTGRTMCGHTAAMDQERVDYERAGTDRKPLSLADLPECGACIRSAQAEAGDPS